MAFTVYFDITNDNIIECPLLIVIDGIIISFTPLLSHQDTICLIKSTMNDKIKPFYYCIFFLYSSKDMSHRPEQSIVYETQDYNDIL